MRHITEKLVEHKHFILLVAFSPIYYVVLHSLYRSKKITLFYILLVSLILQYIFVLQDIL